MAKEKAKAAAKPKAKAAAKPKAKAAAKPKASRGQGTVSQKALGKALKAGKINQEQARGAKARISFQTGGGDR